MAGGLGPARRLFSHPPFLRWTVLGLLAAIAALLFFLGRANRRIESLEKSVRVWEIAKRPRFTLDEMLAGKPAELSRPVYLAFLRRIFPDADGFERRPDPDRFEVILRGERIGFARLYVGDIDCGVCRDVEVFIGVDLEGRVRGFAPVKEIEIREEVRAVTPEDFFKGYLGKGRAEEILASNPPIVGATKSSSKLLEGVLETLRQLEGCRHR